MVRILFFSLSFLVVCALSFGDENKRKEIVGEWEVVKKNVIDVTKDGLVEKFTEKEVEFGIKGNMIKGTYSVDPSKTPAQITITFVDGDKKIIVKGIYKIEDNKLIQKTALDSKDFQYPKDFSIDEKYETLELVKKGKEAPAKK